MLALHRRDKNAPFRFSPPELRCSTWRLFSAFPQSAFSISHFFFPILKSIFSFPILLFLINIHFYTLKHFYGEKTRNQYEPVQQCIGFEVQILRCHPLTLQDMWLMSSPSFGFGHESGHTWSNLKVHWGSLEREPFLRPAGSAKVFRCCPWQNYQKSVLFEDIVSSLIFQKVKSTLLFVIMFFICSFLSGGMQEQPIQAWYWSKIWNLTTTRCNSSSSELYNLSLILLLMASMIELAKSLADTQFRRGVTLSPRLWQQ